MISSLAVGATFKIIDDASPALRRIADELKVLQEQIERTKVAFTSLARTTFAGVTERLQAVNAELTGMGDLGATAADKMALSFDRAAAAMSTSLARVSEQMARIAVQGEEVGVATAAGAAGARAPLILPSRSGAGGGGGGGTRSALRSRGSGGGGFSMYAPTGIHGVHYGTHNSLGIGALISGGAIAYGGWEESEIEDKITAMYLESGQAKAGVKMQDDPFYQQIRGGILGAYTRTGMPVQDITQAYNEAIRISNPLEMDDRLKLISGMMPYASLEAKVKGVTVSQALSAMMKNVHMAGAYNPDDTPTQVGALSLAKHLAYLSTTTDASPEELQRAASYVIPLQRISHFNPLDLLSLITAFQRGGITNTKAGTWINNMFERSFLGVLPPNASKMQKQQYDQKKGEMRELGLLDANDKETFLGPDGTPSAFKFLDTMAAYVANTPMETVRSRFKQMFGAQGERGSAFLSDPVNLANIRKSQAIEKNFETGEVGWDYQIANNPMTTFRTTFAGLNTELINLGSNVLPYVTNMLKQANAALGGKGELEVAGAGLAAWATKGWWGPLLGRAAAAVMSSPIGVAIAALSVGDSNDPHAKDAGANGPTVAQRLRSWLWGSPLGPEGAADNASHSMRLARGYATQPTAIDSAIDTSLHNQRFLRDQSADRASMPPVQVQSNVSIASTPVTLVLNGAAIANAVMGWVVRDAQHVFGPSSFDGASMPSSVDHGLVGHH